ncbi:thioredoxin-like protein [Phellopilus nigrolimitatus]|nr:thioredoxin-like protein [Phellopilus nigrolimitatus]
MLSSIRSYLFSRPSSSSSTNMVDVKTLVNSTIANNRIVVFSKSYCPYCAKAKTLLQSKYGGVSATILELDQRGDGAEIQSYLLEKTEQRTVPSIFIDEKHIGGSSDLSDLEDKGELATLINKPAL